MRDEWNLRIYLGRFPPEWLLALLIGLIFGLDADQPILENYVGRQVPTAMVAQNLARGSGFLHPQLDTGPFPNLFLVEPPIYAGGVAMLAHVTGLSLDRCGRYASALGMVLLCWGASGLVRHQREGMTANLVYLVVGLLPIFHRFGRAFQPDVFALGLVLAGSRLWDAHEDDGGRLRLTIAWLLTSIGFAVKVSTAYALVPLIVIILRPRTRAKIALAISTLAVAALWYVYAAWMLRQGVGSRASADNATHWLSAISLLAWTKPETYQTVWRTVGWRAFSPIGLPIALCAFYRPWAVNRFWRVWLLSATAMLLLLGGKLHHEYYFLALGPPVAVGLARSFEILLTRRRHKFLYAVLLAALLGILGTFGQRAWERTRSTPPEWAAWPEAVEVIRNRVPPGEWLAAPEALLYLANRNGCRLEYEPKARLRAAGEWGTTVDRDDPLALVELYRSKGAKYVADLWPVGDEPDRRVLHDAIRLRYNVIMDRDGVIVAELVDRRN